MDESYLNPFNLSTPKVDDFYSNPFILSPEVGANSSEMPTSAEVGSALVSEPLTPDEQLFLTKDEELGLTQETFNKLYSSFGGFIDGKRAVQEHKLDPAKLVPEMESRYAAFNEWAKSNIPELREGELSSAFDKYAERQKNWDVANAYGADDGIFQHFAKKMILTGLTPLGAFGLEQDEVAASLGSANAEGLGGEIADTVAGAVGQTGGILAAGGVGAAVGSIVPVVGTGIGFAVGSLGAIGAQFVSQLQDDYQKGYDLTGTDRGARNAMIAASPIRVLENAIDALLIGSGPFLKTMFGIGSKTTSSFIKSGISVAAKAKHASPSAVRKILQLSENAEEVSKVAYQSLGKAAMKGGMMEAGSESILGTIMANEAIEFGTGKEFFDPTSNEGLKEIFLSAIGGAVGGAVLGAGGAMRTNTTPIIRDTILNTLGNSAVESFAKGEAVPLPFKNKELAIDFASRIGGKVLVNEETGNLKIAAPEGFFTPEESRSILNSMEITEKRLEKLASAMPAKDGAKSPVGASPTTAEAAPVAPKTAKLKVSALRDLGGDNIRESDRNIAKLEIAFRNNDPKVTQEAITEAKAKRYVTGISLVKKADEAVKSGAQETDFVDLEAAPADAIETTANKLTDADTLVSGLKEKTKELGTPAERQDVLSKLSDGEVFLLEEAAQITQRDLKDTGEKNKYAAMARRAKEAKELYKKKDETLASDSWMETVSNAYGSIATLTTPEGIQAEGGVNKTISKLTQARAKVEDIAKGNPVLKASPEYGKVLDSFASATDIIRAPNTAEDVKKIREANKVLVQQNKEAEAAAKKLQEQKAKELAPKTAKEIEKAVVVNGESLFDIKNAAENFARGIESTNKIPNKREGISKYNQKVEAYNKFLTDNKDAISQFKLKDGEKLTPLTPKAELPLTKEEKLVAIQTTPLDEANLTKKQKENLAATKELFVGEITPAKIQTKIKLVTSKIEKSKSEVVKAKHRKTLEKLVSLLPGKPRKSMSRTPYSTALYGSGLTPETMRFTESVRQKVGHVIGDVIIMPFPESDAELDIITNETDRALVKNALAEVAEVDGVTAGVTLRGGGLTQEYIFINSKLPEHEQKMTIAHEVGHVVGYRMLETLGPETYQGIVDSMQGDLDAAVVQFKAMPSMANYITLVGPTNLNVDLATYSYNGDLDYVASPEEYFANQFAKAASNDNYYPDTILGNIAKTIRTLVQKIMKIFSEGEALPIKQMDALYNSLIGDFGHKLGVEIQKRANNLEETNALDEFVQKQYAQIELEDTYHTRIIGEKTMGLSKLFTSNKVVQGVIENLRGKVNLSYRDYVSVLKIAAASLNYQTSPLEKTGASDTETFGSKIPEYVLRENLIAYSGASSSQVVDNLITAIGRGLWERIASKSLLTTAELQALIDAGGRAHPNYPNNLKLRESFGVLLKEYLHNDSNKMGKAERKLLGLAMDQYPAFKDIILNLKGKTPREGAIIGSESPVIPFLYKPEVDGFIQRKTNAITHWMRRFNSIHYTQKDLTKNILNLAEQGGFDASDIAELNSMSKQAEATVGVTINSFIGGPLATSFAGMPTLYSILQEVPRHKKSELDEYLIYNSIIAYDNYYSSLRAKYEDDLVNYRRNLAFDPSAKKPIEPPKGPGIIRNEVRVAEARAQMARVNKDSRVVKAAEQIYDLQVATLNYIKTLAPALAPEVDILLELPRENIPLIDSADYEKQFDPTVKRYISNMVDTGNPSLVQSLVNGESISYNPPINSMLARLSSKMNLASKNVVVRMLATAELAGRKTGSGLSTGVVIEKLDAIDSDTKEMLTTEKKKLLVKEKEGTLTPDEIERLDYLTEAYSGEAALSDKDYQVFGKNGEFMIGGERVVIAIPKEMYERYLTYPSLEELMNNSNTFFQFSNKLTSIFRRAVVKYNPPYILQRQAVYDAFGFLVNDRSGGNIVSNSYRFFTQFPLIWQVRDMMGLTAPYERSIRQAVREQAILQTTVSNFYSQDAVMKLSDMYGVEGVNVKTGKQYVFKTGNSLSRLLDQWMREVDLTSRGGAAINFLKQHGLDGIQDASQLSTRDLVAMIHTAKNITVDYSNKGYSIFHQTMPFVATAWGAARANIEGMRYNLSQGGTHTLNYLGFTMLPLMIAGIAIKEALDDDDRDLLSKGERVNGWAIRTPLGMVNIKVGLPSLIMMNAFYEMMRDASDGKLKLTDALHYGTNTIAESTAIAPSSVGPMADIIDRGITDIIRQSPQQGDFPGGVMLLSSWLGLEGPKVANKYAESDLGSRLVEFAKGTARDIGGNWGTLASNLVLAATDPMISGENKDPRAKYALQPRSWEDFFVKYALGVTPMDRFYERNIYKLKETAILVNDSYEEIFPKFEDQSTPKNAALKTMVNDVNSAQKLVSAINSLAYSNPKDEVFLRRQAAHVSRATLGRYEEFESYFKRPYKEAEGVTREEYENIRGFLYKTEVARKLNQAKDKVARIEGAIPMQLPIWED